MTTEHRSRKSNATKDPLQRSKSNLVQASGDSAPGNSPVRLKSKNTLPKSLRYDLENALVGLCDVWFEDIKPYLERNNIKLHVHEAAARGDADGGDAAAPECSHLHPASSAARCELCRLLFNAANSIESAVSQAAGASAPSSNAGDLYAHAHQMQILFGSSQLNQRLNYSKKSECRNVKRRTRKRKPASETLYPKHLVPRLCRMYSVSIQSPSQQRTDPTYFMAPATNQKLPQGSKPKVKRTKNKPELKDASTQTEVLLRVTTIKPSLRKRQKPGVQFERLPARNGFVHSKNSNMEINKDASIPDNAEFPHLFKNDLIDIIGEKHDEMLKISHSTNEEQQFSLLNLFTTFKPGQHTSGRKKIRPWR